MFFQWPKVFHPKGSSIPEAQWFEGVLQLRALWHGLESGQVPAVPAPQTDPCAVPKERGMGHSSEQSGLFPHGAS